MANFHVVLVVTSFLTMLTFIKCHNILLKDKLSELKGSGDNITASLLQFIVTGQFKIVSLFVDEGLFIYPILAEAFVHKVFSPVILDHIDQPATENHLYLIFGSKVNSFIYELDQLSLVNDPTFVMIWQNSDKVESSDVYKVFNYFWRYNFTSVLAVVEDNNLSVKFYSFSLFTENSCGVVGPVETEMWTEKRKIIYNRLISKSKLFNLNGCKLHINVRNRPPDMKIKRANSKTVYEGSGGLLLKTVMDKLNFTVHISFMGPSSYNRDSLYPNQGIDEFLVSDIENLCCENLYNRSKDIVVGTFSNLLFSHELGVELAYPIYQECLLFHAPCGMGPVKPPWITFVKAFSLTTWLCLTVSVILVVVVAHAIAKTDENQSFTVENTLFYLFGLFFNVSLPANHKSNAIHFLIGHILVAFLIISVVFEASLKSYKSTRDFERENIKSFKEIDDMKLEIVGTPQAYKILNNTSGENYVLNNLIKRFTVVQNGTYRSLVDKMITERKTVIFGPQRLVLYYSYNRTEKDPDDVCQVEPCVFKAYSSPFVFRKGSFLIKPFNSIIQRLYEGGVVEKWWAMSSPVSPRRVAVSKITIGEVSSGIYVLLFGLGLSVAVFIVELFYCKHNCLQVKRL